MAVDLWFIFLKVELAHCYMSKVFDVAIDENKCRSVHTHVVAKSVCYLYGVLALNNLIYIFVFLDEDL